MTADMQSPRVEEVSDGVYAYIQPDGSWYINNTERIVGNLHCAYAELAGASRGAEVDLTAALTGMITYKGGRPLTCHA